MFDSLILNILHPTAMLSAAMLAGIYRWVRWNHIRGVLCALSAVLYAVAGFNVAG